MNTENCLRRVDPGQGNEFKVADSIIFTDYYLYISRVTISGNFGKCLAVKVVSTLLFVTNGWHGVGLQSSNLLSSSKLNDRETLQTRIPHLEGQLSTVYGEMK